MVKHRQFMRYTAATMKLTGGTDGAKEPFRFCRLSGLEQIVAVGKNQLAFAVCPKM
jgi:hypothetical protein